MTSLALTESYSLAHYQKLIFSFLQPKRVFTFAFLMEVFKFKIFSPN